MGQAAALRHLTRTRHRLKMVKSKQHKEQGMSKILENVNFTIIAGLVLTLIVAFVGPMLAK
jgi:uncharacterized membrane protein